MKLENILCELKPKGRSKLVGQILDIRRVVNSSEGYDMQGYYKHKTNMLCINYKLTSHQLSDITKKINDSVDKDEKVLRRYMQELKYGVE